MTEHEKQKMKKINEMTLQPFRIMFPYKEFDWTLSGKSVVAFINNVFPLDDHLILGSYERIRIEKNLNWNDKNKIERIKKRFELAVRKHRTLAKVQNYINSHQAEFEEIMGD